jgi:hypothetical protein
VADDDLDIFHGGSSSGSGQRRRSRLAICRMLDAGADTYLASSTIPELARHLDRVISERFQLTAGTDTRLEIERPQNG